MATDSVESTTELDAERVVGVRVPTTTSTSVELLLLVPLLLLLLLLWRGLLGLELVALLLPLVLAALVLLLVLFAVLVLVECLTTCTLLPHSEASRSLHAQILSRLGGSGRSGKARSAKWAGSELPPASRVPWFPTGYL